MPHFQPCTPLLPALPCPSLPAVIEQLKRTVTGQEYADVVNKVSEGIQNLP